jgi:nitric oxide reductase large subunit
MVKQLLVVIMISCIIVVWGLMSGPSFAIEVVSTTFIILIMLHITGISTILYNGLFNKKR